MILKNGVIINGKNYELVHISQIRNGDTIFHNGFERTINKEFIKRSSFMGISLFGDNYNSGTIKVKRRIYGICR